jgi:hypothetical protein
MHDPLDVSLQIGDLLKKKAVRENRKRLFLRALYYGAIISALLFLTILVSRQ